MPLRAIINTARALSYYSRVHATTANNLANANTDGFKADRITAQRYAGGAHPVPVQRTDLSQGAVRDTSRPLDVALEGEGFLVVGTADGERLTRGGSLRLDANGVLADSHGDPVLGQDGPIAIVGQAVEIHADGTVLVDGTRAGQLRLETVANPDSLLKEGFGRFRAADATQPVPEGTVSVRQGAIEDANFDALQGMVDLILTQRAYSANADALHALDSVLGTVTGDVGRV